MDMFDEDILKGITRFTLKERLGEGGMGVVYSAHDKDLDITVALKTLKENDSETLLRLKKEFRALQGLRHPNLISFGELFEQKGKWFFSMEYIRGEDFLSFVRVDNALRELNALNLARDLEPERGALAGAHESEAEVQGGSPSKRRYDEHRLREGLAQLAGGLMALHGAGRLHRDIKPDNIMVETSGRVVLMDFGLVTESEQNMKTMSRFFPVGTSSYMSPEQAASASLKPSSDWYSVGVVLFQALTGRLPFEGTFSAVVLEKQRSAAPSPRIHDPDIPEELCRLCEELLQFDPKLRPTGPEILERLRSSEAPVRPVSQPSASSEELFVGRSGELEQLAACLDAYRGGESQVVLLHGPSGLGKTALARHFLHRLTGSEDRVLILSGRCAEQESVSFNAFDQLIDTLSQVLLRLPEEELFYVIPKNGAMLTRLFPVMSRVRVLAEAGQKGPASGNLQEFRSLAFAALKDLLVRLADRYYVCLFIDNCQWADEDSGRLLDTLVSEPGRPVLFLMLGQRTVGTDEREQAGSRELVEVPCEMVRIPLGPLDPDESALMVTRMDRLQPDVEKLRPEVVQRIVQESRGHPLFIQELVRHLAERHDESKEVPPLELDSVLWRRIERLEEPEQRIAVAVSFAGAPLPLRALAELLDTPAGQVLRGLQVLQIAHLVKSSQRDGERLYEPFHDRVRAAVKNNTDEEAARSWHHRLAYLFKALADTSPKTLGYHFEAAGDVGLAIGYYTSAGNVATESLAFTRAAGLFRKALVLRTEHNLGSVEEIRALRLLLSSSLTAAGLGREAALELTLAIEGANPVEAMELRQRAGMQYLRAGYFDEGISVLHDQLRQMHIHLPKPGWRTLLALGWRRLRLRFRGLSYRERDETEISGAVLARLDLLKTVSRTVESLLRASMYATRWVHEALDVGEPIRILQAACMEANYLAATGSFDSAYARKVTRLITAILEKHGTPLHHAYLGAAMAYSNYMGGQFGEAHKKAVKVLSIISPERDTHWEAAHMHFIELWSLFYLGEIKEMTRVGTAFFNDSMARGDVWSASGALLGLNNLVFLNKSGPQEALAQADEFMSHWSREGYHLQHFWHFITHIHVDFFNHESRRAHQRIEKEWERLKGSMLLLVPSIRCEALYMRGHACLEMARTAAPSAAKGLLRQARRDASGLAGGKNSWSRAMSGLLRANVSLVSGNMDRGVQEMKGCIETFTALDMVMHAAATRWRLAGIIGGDEGAALEGAARRWFVSQEIRDPEGTVRLLVP